METMLFRITDSYGHYLCDLDIPYVDLYWIKKTFICEIQFGQLILY